MDEFESFLTVPKMKQTTTLMSHIKNCAMTANRYKTTEYVCNKTDLECSIEYVK
jgi:hypothetical protein